MLYAERGIVLSDNLLQDFQQLHGFAYFKTFQFHAYLRPPFGLFLTRKGWESHIAVTDLLGCGVALSPSGPRIQGHRLDVQEGGWGAKDRHLSVG